MKYVSLTSNFQKLMASYLSVTSGGPSPQAASAIVPVVLWGLGAPAARGQHVEPY